jgi:hypothetical protein
MSSRSRSVASRAWGTMSALHIRLVRSSAWCGALKAEAPPVPVQAYRVIAAPLGDSLRFFGSPVLVDQAAELLPSLNAHGELVVLVEADVNVGTEAVVEADVESIGVAEQLRPARAHGSTTPWSELAARGEGRKVLLK